LDLGNLIDFFEKDLFTGYIHIKDNKKEPLVFFDSGQITKCLEMVDNEYKSVSLKSVLNTVKKEEIVNTYYLPEETGIFWPNLANAKILYPNLSNEFTVLLKLVYKLKQEKLTGFIEISISKDRKSFIYFQNGKIIGTCSSWRQWVFDEGERYLAEIIAKSTQATFNVYKISLEKISEENMTLQETIDLFQEYLATAEKIIGEKSFSSLLHQICLEKAKKYPLLDPSTNELKYKEGKISLGVSISEIELTEVLKEVCEEIIKENDLKKKITQQTINLKKKYQDFIKRFELSSLFGEGLT
jgi:hypothetical protein